MALRLSPHLTVMANAAQKASKRLLRDFNEVEQLQVSVKGPSRFRLAGRHPRRADAARGAEQGASRLRLPDGGIRRLGLAELVMALGGRSARRHHQLPARHPALGDQHRAGTPAAPMAARELAAGLIYAPAVDELFWAEKGVGAFVNERRLRVSARRELKEAVFATGIPFAAVAPQRRLAFARTLGVLMPQVAGIRRFGAAALDLAWVAAGRYDGFWELGLKRWDMAAGVLLVREAGGFVTDPGGPGSARHRRRGRRQPASARGAERGGDRGRRHAAIRAREQDESFTHCPPGPFPGNLIAHATSLPSAHGTALRGRARTGAGHRRSAGARRSCLAPNLRPGTRRAQKPKPRPAPTADRGRQAAKPPPQQATEKPAAAAAGGHRIAAASDRRRRSRRRPRCRPRRRPTVALAPVPPPPPAAPGGTATAAADLRQRRQRGNRDGRGAACHLRRRAGRPQPGQRRGHQEHRAVSAGRRQHQLQRRGLCRRHAGRSLDRPAAFAGARPRGAQRADGRRRHLVPHLCARARCHGRRRSARSRGPCRAWAATRGSVARQCERTGCRRQEPVAVTRPNVYLIRMAIFLVAVLAVAATLSPVLLSAYANNPVAQQPDPGGAADRHRLEPAPGAAADARGRLAGDLPDGTPAALDAALAATAGADGQHAGRARGAEPHRPGALHALRLGDAQPARRHRLAARREPRAVALHDRPADLPRPARHVLGPAEDGRRGVRRDRIDVGRLGRSERAVRAAQVGPGETAHRHGHGVLRLDVRPVRRAGAGLPRPHRGPGAEPLLQRARGVAGRTDPALLGRAGGGRRLDAGLCAGAAGADRREHGEPAAHPAARRGQPRAGESGGAGADRAHRDAVGHDAHQPAAHAAHRRGAGGDRAGAAAARRAAPRCGLRRCGARPSAQHRTLSAAPAGRCRAGPRAEHGGAAQ